MSECTKGKLEVGILTMEEMTFKGPYVPIKAPAALMMFDGMLAVVGGLNAEQAEANAKELVRRWNAFEEGGLVDELRDVIKDMLKGLRYMRQTHEIPYGFGIDRLEKTGEAALAKS